MFPLQLGAVVQPQENFKNHVCSAATGAKSLKAFARTFHLQSLPSPSPETSSSLLCLWTYRTIPAEP